MTFIQEAVNPQHPVLDRREHNMKMTLHDSHLPPPMESKFHPFLFFLFSESSLNCILLRKVLNFRKRVSKVLIEWYQFDTSFKYMAESLIVEPINFNIICILLDYNFRQVLIRVAFKLCHQLFVKHRAGCAAKSQES